ncbi:MAG: Ig-like domain-containing protein [Patescibacteria group bacterium]
MNKIKLISFIIVVFVIGFFSFKNILLKTKVKPSQNIAYRSVNIFDTKPSNTSASAFVPFSSSFNVEEAGSMTESASGIFWVSSGGRLTVNNAIADTIQGDLPTTDNWYSVYLASNSIDTDAGLHPQNIFRLVTKNVWKDATQDLYFKINKLNLSTSPNRNASNGIFMMSRYVDSNNLYYTGIRVDGYAVLKKKINGTYFTMASARVFDGTYNHDTMPNLLPTNTWVGFKTETINNSNGGVDINIYIDKTGDGTWIKVLSSTDNNTSYGGNSFINAGYAGLRTDFMDVSFKSYELKDITPVTTEPFPTTPPVVVNIDYSVPPVITILKPADNTSISKKKDLVVGIKGSDDSGISKIAMSIDNNEVKNCTSSPSCTFTVSMRNYSFGKHSITVKITDNESQSSISNLTINVVK